MYIIVLFVLFSASIAHPEINSVEDVQSLIFETINETAPDFEPCNRNLLQKAVFGDMIEIKRHGYFH